MDRRLGISKEEYVHIQRQKDAESFRYDTNQKIQELFMSLDDVKKSIHDLNITYLTHKMVMKNEVNNFGIACEGIKSAVFSKLADFKTFMEKQAADTCKAIQDTREFLINYIQSGGNEIWISIQNLEKELEKLRTEFCGIIELNAVNAEKKIQESKKEILSIPSEIPRLRQELSEKLDLISLDCMNALMRSANNEKQLHLIEKKIENIYQLIKKIDLQKQET